MLFWYLFYDHFDEDKLLQTWDQTLPMIVFNFKGKGSYNDCHGNVSESSDQSYKHSTGPEWYCLENWLEYALEL